MFEGQIDVAAQDLRTTSSTRQHKLGTLGRASRGRQYRYGRAGAVDLAAGKLVTTAAVVANHQNIAVLTGAINATIVTATLGATAATADQYAGGTLTVNDSTGAGIDYAIKGNKAAASSGAITIYLETTEPLKVALTTSSKVSLNTNDFDAVVISAGAVALKAVGVPNVAVTAAYYAWFQTKGRCSILSDGVIGIGSGAIISDAVNGAVEVEVAGTVTQRIGTARQATVDAKYYPIDLRLE